MIITIEISRIQGRSKGLNPTHDV